MQLCCFQHSCKHPCMALSCGMWITHVIIHLVALHHLRHTYPCCSVHLKHERRTPAQLPENSSAPFASSPAMHSALLFKYHLQLWSSLAAKNFLFKELEANICVSSCPSPEVLSFCSLLTELQQIRLVQPVSRLCCSQSCMFCFWPVLHVLFSTQEKNIF